MLDRIALEQFLNKNIVFSWKNVDKQTFSHGTLLKVTDTEITILFKGKLQLFSLESLITMREEDVPNNP